MIINMSTLYILLCFIVLAVPTFADGFDLQMYEIVKGNFSVKLTNYGARIVSLVLPDKNGNLGDIVLGYDTIKAYQNDSSYFGATVGRVANRIAGANFTLNGTLYKLDANQGTNMLHGIRFYRSFYLFIIFVRFDSIVFSFLQVVRKDLAKVAWKVKKHVKYGPSPSITFTYRSVDGEEGFPGDVDISVTYKIIEPYALRIRMNAKPKNKATPINLAQHTYWNLAGHASGNILSHELQIFASHVTPVGPNLIPTGEIQPVKSTPYDFLKPRAIKEPMKELPQGYDINYAVDGRPNGKKVKPVAVVYSKESGRIMKLSGNAPGVQLYTGNYVRDVVGKGGYVYQSHAGLCLETQGFPDSVNHPNFPSQIVLPGETYRHRMLFSFSTHKSSSHA